MCKFTPLGFETLFESNGFYYVDGVNLPRWGLKQIPVRIPHSHPTCVNLPRWGLKLGVVNDGIVGDQSVNLPRWGLKPASSSCFLISTLCKFTPLGFETCVCVCSHGVSVTCKFTPLGFETIKEVIHRNTRPGVNLPRWGLKLFICFSRR